MAGGGDAQMYQFSLAASQASGNLPEGVGAAQLAKEHGHKLAPAGKSSAMSFGFALLYGLDKFGFRKKLQKLAEYATKPIHRSSLDVAFDFSRNQFTTSSCEDLFF
jgi:hypothetical protein